MQTLRTFDFNALDDIGFAAERGSLIGRSFPRSRVYDIGPLFEFLQLSEAGVLPPFDDALWLEKIGFDPMLEAMSRGCNNWFCEDVYPLGYLKISSISSLDDRAWISFSMKAKRAAISAGFSNAISAQLTSSLGELYSNIHEHSGRPSTGVIAFQSQSGAFEFVASDQGIGILESLKSSPDGMSIASYGEALRLALTDGVSRFGSESSRGHGFRPLFLGLANINGSLRFRSGDHALLRAPNRTISGRISSR